MTEDTGHTEERGEEPAPEPPRITDRVDYDPAYDPAAPIICELCGGIMHYTASCRILCSNCGYTRDCADP